MDLEERPITETDIALLDPKLRSRTYTTSTHRSRNRDRHHIHLNIILGLSRRTCLRLRGVWHHQESPPDDPCRIDLPGVVC